MSPPCLLLFVFLLLVGCVHGNNNNVVKCRVGWGGEERIIPAERINDDYCDCPWDGADEPDTNACAGSVGWAGIADKTTQDDDIRPNLFPCPQQPKLQLPLSRVNDGVCDCCDGSDETKTGACPDICDEVLAEERAALARAREVFAIGYEKRQTLLADFESLHQDTLQEINVKQKQLEEMRANEKEVQEKVRDAKREYMSERLKLAEEVRNNSKDLVDPLNQDELIALIVQSCQLAGEMEESEGSTCVPLRLAGLDMGFVWDDEDFGLGMGVFRPLLEEENEWETIANLMDKHARGEGLDWSKKDQTEVPPTTMSTRDYSDEEDDEEDYHRDYDDDMDDDGYYPDDDMVYHSNRHRPKKQTKPDINEEIRQEIRSSHLSRFRVRFLQNADDLIGRIDDLTNDDRDLEEEDDDEDSDVGEEGSTSGDPMAFQMTRNTLERRKQSIDRGFDFAASGLVLSRTVVAQAGVDSEDLQRWLKNLAIGTLMYGNIRAQDVWQLTVMNVPEFGYKVADIGETCNTSEDVGTCMASESAAFDAHLAGICPPRIIESRGSPFPPESVVAAGHSLCENWSTDHPTMVCASNPDDELPTSIPDGYCGYFEVHPRHPAEVLSEKIGPLLSFGPSPKISEVEGKLQKLEEEHRKLDKEINELYERIGGRKQDKFGDNGELHSLRDECLSVEAGKYTYEVCLFGKASQKDRDESRGNDLGRWKGMTIDSETGKRVMTWSGGAKCWNGPQRSATVYVACGVETKVLSAEEPDTCRYELEMESPIACDEEYKERFGL